LPYPSLAMLVAPALVSAVSHAMLRAPNAVLAPVPHGSPFPAYRLMPVPGRVWRSNSGPAHHPEIYRRDLQHRP